MMTLDGHEGRVRGLAYTPDGSTLASCGDDGTVRLWDRATGRSIWSRDGHPGLVGDRGEVSGGVAISPGGAWLASAGIDGEVLVWSLARSSPDETPPRELNGRGRLKVGSVVFVDDVNLVYGGWIRNRYRNGNEEYGHVRHRDLATGSHRAVGLGLFAVRGIAAHPTSGSVAIGVRAGRGDEVGVFLWDSGADRQVPVSPGPVASHVRSLTYSPDGRRLAASQKDEIAIWDAGSLTLATTLRGHAGRVRGVAYAPGGSALASASDDGTVRIWDPETGAALGCYDWGIGPVDCVAFAPDGMTIAAGGRGGIVVWDAGWA